MGRKNRGRASPPSIFRLEEDHRRNARTHGNAESHIHTRTHTHRQNESKASQGAENVHERHELVGLLTTRTKKERMAEHKLEIPSGRQNNSGHNVSAEFSRKKKRNKKAPEQNPSFRVPQGLIKVADPWSETSGAQAPNPTRK